ncbi:MAG: hypothetical protein ABIB71_09580 [Candidatus Woesearchaeota archaeon]
MKLKLPAKAYKIKCKTDSKIVGYLSQVIKEYREVFENLAK